MFALQETGVLSTNKNVRKSEKTSGKDMPTFFTTSKITSGEAFSTPCWYGVGNASFDVVTWVGQSGIGNASADVIFS
ncbi:hypothetical protein E5676_scaffold236G00190 [Cucumis melo var. makuwa]|uniref:Uncharacterized protein n=1 Tax=Cucumis melo var. makuwa TaxID=1194695 RepID=A0A5A7TYD3_CUCMM|nr:hypothetical protein E6C27_scaffold61G002240 [Cucumis melo var. makuwa]TYK27171.1 hypothetical protein E5676_scaffold236G00190 [Cucumis melo var. makuwa]